MKKGTSAAVLISCTLSLVALGINQYFFSHHPSVASAVYEEVYTVTEDVYELPVYQDVYFEGVDSHYEDPVVPDGPILGIMEDLELSIDYRVTNLALGHEYGVYTVSDGENSDIWLLNLANGEITALTEDSFEQTSPAIYGNIIVWQDNRNGNWDLYLFDLDRGKEYQLTDDPNDQIQPHIYKNTVVWQDNRNGNWDIYMVDLLDGEAIPLVASTNYQTNPQVFGDNVIWQNLEDNGHWQIYWHNLTTTKTIKLSEMAAQNCNATLTGDKVAWTKYEDNKWQLMLYNLSEGQFQELSGFPVYLASPVIYDKLLVYNCSAGGELESNVFDTQANRQLQLSTSGSIHDVFGTQLLWVTSLTDGEQQMHLGQLKF